MCGLLLSFPQVRGQRVRREPRCPSQKQDWLLFKLVSAIVIVLVTLVFQRLKYLYFIFYEKERYQVLHIHRDRQ